MIEERTVNGSVGPRTRSWCCTAGSMGVKQGLENVVHAAQIADKKH